MISLNAQPMYQSQYKYFDYSTANSIKIANTKTPLTQTNHPQNNTPKKICKYIILIIKPQMCTAR